MLPSRLSSALRHVLRDTWRTSRLSSPSVSLLNDYRKSYSSENFRVEEEPPSAKKEACEREAYGLLWQDSYAWMENLKDPAMHAHIRKENRYAEAAMSDTQKLQQVLRREMRDRMALEENSPPEVWGSWYYYTRIPEGREYPLFCRSPLSNSMPGGASVGHLKATEDKESNKGDWWKNLKWALRFPVDAQPKRFGEEVMLDQNDLAEQLGYSQIGECHVSPDHRWLAFTLDSSGHENFDLVIREIKTGETLLQHRIHGVANVEWAEDSNTFFYSVINDLLRPYRVLRRTLDAKEGEEDDVVLECEDPEKYVDISRTKDWRFITLNINSKTTSEVFLIDAQRPLEKPRLVEPQKVGTQYFVEHHSGFLYILTNSVPGSEGELELVRTPQDRPGRASWQALLEAEKEDRVVLEDMEVFEHHLVLFRRRKGLPEVVIVDLPLEASAIPVPFSKLRKVILPQTVCSVSSGANKDFYSSSFRLIISSPNMPEACFDCHLATGKLTLLQQQPLLSGLNDEPRKSQSKKNRIQRTGSVVPSGLFSKTNLEGRLRDTEQVPLVNLNDEILCERVEAVSYDGVIVPLTLIRLKKLPKDGCGPALLVGYGAYGVCLPVEWCPQQLSLLRRGWTIALAHTRGGGELGKAWHAAGKLQYKENSFHDFLACAHFLVREGYSSPDLLAAKGTSAGGLLVGAAVNMEPELFRALVLKVPFLDICGNMLNENLPLTAHEYEEWGHPADKGVSQRLFGYSPCSNIQPGKKYPATFITASLNDTRVGCWEAAKWVSRNRELNGFTKSRPFLLKTGMDSGHMGEGGRYRQLEDVALEYAFLLKYVGEYPPENWR